MLIQEEVRQREELGIKPTEAHLTLHNAPSVIGSSNKAPSKKGKKKGKQPMKVLGDEQKVLKCYFCGKHGHKKADCLKHKA